MGRGRGEITFARALAFCRLTVRTLARLLLAPLLGTALGADLRTTRLARRTGRPPRIRLAPPPRLLFAGIPSSCLFT